jgi:hypothetical protein
MKFEPIEVQCYSGYKVHERPLRFRLHDREYHIAEVVDRWYEGSTDSALPQVDYFKVKTEDDQIHIICYNKMFDRWSLLIGRE